jgi:hypothetical protein
MSTLQRATVIGLVSGLVCFVILSVFLILTLLIIHTTGRSHADMLLTVKIAVPAAALTAVAGFIVAVVRLRTIDKQTIDKNR